MSVPNRGVVVDAFALLRPSLVLRQIGLGAAVVLLGVLWLRVPDSNPLWLGVTAALGVAIVALAGCGETMLLLRVAGVPRSRNRLLLGALLVLAFLLLWSLTGTLLDHLSAGDDLRAGYLNSRFGQHARYLFTYTHIQRWLGWLWSVLDALLVCAAGALCLAAIGAAKPAAAILRALRSPAYWLAALIALCFAPWATQSLMNWVPGHGLGIETASLVLRGLCVVLLDGISTSLLIAVLAVLLRNGDDHSLAATSEGTPPDSQPRTAETP